MKEKESMFLADKVPQHSRSYIQKLLKDGLVLADNEKVKQNYRVRAGNIIDMNIPPPKRYLWSHRPWSGYNI